MKNMRVVILAVLSVVQAGTTATAHGPVKCDGDKNLQIIAETFFVKGCTQLAGLNDELARSLKGVDKELLYEQVVNSINMMGCRDL